MRRSLSAACLAFTVAVVVVVGACDNGGSSTTPTGPPEPLQIGANSDETHVKPNESKSVVFTLRDAAGQPVAGRVMQVYIADPSEARGATLSIDRGETGSTGDVPVQIIGGQPTEFTVRASAQGARDKDVRVSVTPEDSGPIEVAPELGPGAGVETIHVLVFPRMSCSVIPRGDPKHPDAEIRMTTPGKAAHFGVVSAVAGHAVYGIGVDARGLQVVEGCVDLSGGAIRAETTIRVVLPLAPLGASPVGSFLAISRLQSPEPAPPPLKQLHDSWKRLDACELDPGRLWLDCTQDALGPASNDDPLDCIPTVADEKFFDGRLAAMRGLLLQTAPEKRCRHMFDGLGHPSLEKQMGVLFAGTPQLLSDVKAIAAEAELVLRTFQLASRIDVARTSQTGQVQLDHHLVALELATPGDPVTVPIAALGVPVASARFVPAVVKGTGITIERHGFTLRLGSLARTGFLESALFRRGFPADTTKFIAGVFGTASHTTSAGVSYKGCPALAAMICPLIGGGERCLVDACEKGNLALGQALHDAFAALDGNELDFFLQGAAPLIDRNGDGRADFIGYFPNSPGVWKAIVRWGDEQFTIPGVLASDRLNP